MGIYDEYGSCQLKIGDVSMRVYEEGDEVPIPDGVYIDYGGAVVIIDGIFVKEFETILDKYGGVLNIKEIIDQRNPVALAVKDFIKGE